MHARAVRTLTSSIGIIEERISFGDAVVVRPVRGVSVPNASKRPNGSTAGGIKTGKSLVQLPSAELAPRLSFGELTRRSSCLLLTAMLAIVASSQLQAFRATLARRQPAARESLTGLM